jgi:hypothetical protein
VEHATPELFMTARLCGHFSYLLLETLAEKFRSAKTQKEQIKSRVSKITGGFVPAR